MTGYVDPLPKQESREGLSGSLGPTLILITLVFIWVQFARPFDWKPLSYVNPQEPLVSSIHAGGAIPIRGTKCNDTDGAVSVSGKVYLVRLEPRTPKLVHEGEAVRPPGCTTATWDNPIPADTAPGAYRFEGIEVAEDGERVQRGAWYSDPFGVVAP